MTIRSSPKSRSIYGSASSSAKARYLLNRESWMPLLPNYLVAFAFLADVFQI
jgi:hypothetical protein